MKIKILDKFGNNKLKGYFESIRKFEYHIKNNNDIRIGKGDILEIDQGNYIEKIEYNGDLGYGYSNKTKREILSNLFYLFYNRELDRALI